MQIRNVPFHEVTRIVASVSAALYEGNVIPDRFARDSGTRKGGFQGRIIVSNSKGLGARRSGSGRRGPFACWHAFRDVFIAIFDAYPEAVIVTAFARYEGREGFYANYPATRTRNAGSMVVPVEFGNLCECDGNVPETAAENRARFESAFAGRYALANHYGDDDLAYSPDAVTFTAEDSKFLDSIGLTVREP